MPVGSIKVRVVVDSDSLRLVSRVGEALEAAEMVGTTELLTEVAAGACETVFRDGCMRVALRPYAELMLREILDIAERPGLTSTIREVFARQAMVDAGYLPRRA